MLKLLVFCIVVVTVVVKPAALRAANLVALYTYSSMVAPATTTITKQESSIVHPLPHYYSAPLVYKHYIKKRSALLGLPVYCAPSTYVASPLLPHIFPFPYSIPQTYLVPATFSAPFNHILKKPVLTYTGESTIPLNVETHKNDIFNNVPKNEANINRDTEAPKYEIMSTKIFNKDSASKEPVQRDSYGKPLMNIPAVTASNEQNCTYDLKALFENGSLICEDPQNSKNVE